MARLEDMIFSPNEDGGNFGYGSDGGGYGGIEGSEPMGRGRDTPPPPNYQDILYNQIMGQNLTGKWTGQGHGNPAANATHMAQILSGAGITDIKQFGKVPTYTPVTEIYKTYNGKQVTEQGNEDGTTARYIMEPTGKMEEFTDWEGNQGVRPEMRRVDVPKDAKLKGVYGIPNPDYVPFDSPSGQYSSTVTDSDVIEKDGQLVTKTGETFGNKVTGQAVASNYNKAGGNVWSGTFAGKGSTSYGVQFQPDGTPVFYTQYGGSSNDFKDYAPLLALAGLAFGAPLLGEALAGAGAGAAELGALSALDAGMGVYGASGLGAGTGLLGGAEVLSALDAGMGVYPTLGISDAVGGAALSALDAGIGAYPTTGNIGLDGLISPVEITGTPSPVDLVSPVEITGTPAPSLVDKAISAASNLSASDVIRLAGIAATVAGGANLVGSAGDTGSGGFPIVPIPSDWTSPPPTSTAAFTPLPEIDFGNKEMLRGTQWEKLLSPDYGKAPAPTQYAQPSNMSYDELTRILGGSKTSVPTQSLTINDVISGIQNQYGQTPQGAVG